MKDIERKREGLEKILHKGYDLLEEDNLLLIEVWEDYKKLEEEEVKKTTSE